MNDCVVARTATVEHVDDGDADRTSDLHLPAVGSAEPDHRKTTSLESLVSLAMAVDGSSGPVTVDEHVRQIVTMSQI